MPGGGGADGDPGVLIKDVEDAQQSHEHSGEYFINVQIEHGELEDRSDISLALELIQLNQSSPKSAGYLAITLPPVCCSKVLILASKVLLALPLPKKCL